MKKLTALFVLLGFAFIVVGCDPAPKDEPSAPSKTTSNSDKTPATAPEPTAKSDSK